MASNGIRVGLVGTSWWAEAMYLPALAEHPDGRITAICGRNRARADEVATQWSIDQVFDHAESMITSGDIDAIIIASTNDTHHPLTLLAAQHGIHVLCEKPLGVQAGEADEMTAAVDTAGLVSMTPFTYRHMPMNRQVKRYVDEGYIGTPYHMAGRYYTGYARDGDYLWRFDAGEAGSGVIGDLGTHWIDMAIDTLGPVAAVSAITTSAVPRAPRPDGHPYQPGEDVAMMTLRFVSGALGQITVSAACWEGGGFNQSHHIEVHGSEGTIYAMCDWETVQRVTGRRADQQGTPTELERSPDIWDGLRTDTVHNTYRDVFRTSNVQARAWVAAIAAGETVQPDLAAGAAAQRVAEAALESATLGGTSVDV